MTAVVTATGPEEESEARRNAFLLTAAAALGGSAPAIAISLGGLAGSYLLGADKSAATLPVSFFIAGGAIGAIPAALLMQRIGRRAGFIVGSVAGILGGVGAGWFLLAGSFIGFVVALGLAGTANAFINQYRFAAADSGSPALRARAISWILAGGIASAVIGPQTIIYTRSLFEPIPFAGAFFAMAVLAALGIVFLLFLQGRARAVATKVTASGGRPLSVIVRQPRFIVALLTGTGSFAVMSLVMTAAPLAMVACGIGQDDATLGIQWHILAMFGPSLFTGALIARFGKEAVIGMGLALLAGCAATALAGIDVMNFWLALILLGLGWNFGFIGATAMLTETYRPEERNKVQGFNDFVLFSVVALASFSSGKLLTSVGWEAINLIVFPVAAVCGLALVSVLIFRRPAASS